MKNKWNFSFLTLLLPALIFSDCGEIISTEYMDSMTPSEIQYYLDSFLSSVSPYAEHEVALYKIIYETIDPFGEITEASGTIAYLLDPNYAQSSIWHCSGTG